MSTSQLRYLETELAREDPSREALRVTDHEELTEGWETSIYALSVSYREDGERRSQDLILRLIPGSARTGQAQKEFGVMSRVARAGIPVPRVYLVGEASPVGAPFILMERVRGVGMAQALAEAAESEVARLLRSMIRNLVRLHRLPKSEIFPDGQAQQAGATQDGFVEPRVDHMSEAVMRYGLADFEPILRWLQERARPGPEAPASVLHNDYHPLNLMIRDVDGEAVVLDWSFAGVGDYRLDLAWCALGVEVTIGDRYRDMLVDLYREASGHPVEGFEYFEVLKLTARLITVAVWLDESVVIPVLKITRRALRNEYKVHVLPLLERVKEITGLQIALLEGL